jgi:hypothetical protein
MEGRMPMDRALMEELRQDIQASGGIITDEIKKKAEEAGLPQEMLEMMANAPAGAGFMPGMGGMPGQMPPGGQRGQGQQSPAKSSDTNWLLLTSGLLLLLMVLTVKVFQRRK